MTLPADKDFITGGSGWAEYSFTVSVTAPTLISPIAGTLQNNLTNNNPSGYLFEWTSIPGATGYVLQVSTSSSFSSLYLNVNVPYTNTFVVGANTYVGYVPSADLPVDTTFYWQVQTLNSQYGSSGWSNTCVSACSFTTANTSAAPILINVSNVGGKNNKVTNDYTPGLRWNEIALPGGATFTTYEVEVSTDKTFNDPTQLCFDVTKNQVPSLQYQTYNNGTTTGLTTAQMDTKSLLFFTPVGSTCPNVKNGSFWEFTPVTQYYWRVRAEVNSGASEWSDWSTVFGFVTSYTRYISATFSPPSGTHLTNNFEQVFSWAPVSPQPQQASYEIQYSYDPNFSTNASGGTTNDPSYVNSKWGLPGGTILYWRVRANGPFGPGLWSNSATVITAGAPPSKLVVSAPQNNDLVSSLTPTLSWHPGENVPQGTTFGTFEVEVSIDPKYGSTIVDDTKTTVPSLGIITTTSDTLTTSLSPSTTYFWRVRACNTALECSVWSTWDTAGGKGAIFRTGP